MMAENLDNDARPLDNVAGAAHAGDYATRAVYALQEIMLNHKQSIINDYTRTNRGELFVLQFLARQNAQVLPSELSLALQASTARVSALLGALEKKGQIERKIDTGNRRNILVTITLAGRQRVKAEVVKIHNGMIEVFQEMGQTDTEDFIRLLKRFMKVSQGQMSGRA
ncbi:MAG: transcriptional regulator [Coriobacteriia bacterium]|nr:transcriptional regulator [Coriobacteriia bacterium]